MGGRHEAGVHEEGRHEVVVGGVGVGGLGGEEEVGGGRVRACEALCRGGGGGGEDLCFKE